MLGTCLTSPHLGGCHFYLWANQTLGPGVRLRNGVCLHFDNKKVFLDHVKMSSLRAPNTLWAKERLGVRGDSGAGWGWGVRKELMVSP